MLIMHFALHASSSFYCMFNFHTLLHTPCTVLVRCFARWRSVRKTLSSWLADHTPAGCWQISPSHLPSVETSVLCFCLRDMIFHQRVFIRAGLLCYLHSHLFTHGAGWWGDIIVTAVTDHCFDGKMTQCLSVSFRKMLFGRKVYWHWRTTLT